MKAYVYDRYGDVEALKLIEMKTPEPANQEVLIEIKAISFNDWDYGYLIGKPFVNRLLKGLFKPKEGVIGCDIAGVVKEVGEEVKDIKLGDRVYCDLSNDNFGAFASHTCALANHVCLIPEAMSFEEAAAIPQAGMLAYQSFIDSWSLKDGQEILINGAGGGVGTLGCQMIKDYDVTLTGVDHGEKLKWIIELGYDKTIDYTNNDFTQLGDVYDCIVDCKSDRPLHRYLKALKPGGKYLTVGGGLHYLLVIFIFGPLIKKMTGKSLEVIGLRANKNLNYFNQRFEEGRLKVIIDGPYKFDELPKWFDYYGQGKCRGKVVITLE